MEASVAPRPLAELVHSPRLLRAASDDRLVALVRSGNRVAFEVVYDRHHRGILSFCRHMLGSREEAEDAVQHTFMAAYRQLAGSDGEMHLRAWLYTIARNRCLSVLRAQREHADIEDVQPATEGLAEQVQQRADLRELLRDLHGLPEDQRAALVLAELGSFPHDDIAHVLDCPRDKVKALVFQARSSLMSSRQARETPCDEIRLQLANSTGGALRRQTLRRHLRQCPGCQEYRDHVKHQRQALAILLPVVPTAGLKGSVLGGVGALGGGAAGGGGLIAAGGAAVAGSGAATGGLGGLVGKAGLVKLLLGATVLGGAAGGVAALNAVTSDSTVSRSARPATIERARDAGPGLRLLGTVPGTAGAVDGPGSVAGGSPGGDVSRDDISGRGSTPGGSASRSEPGTGSSSPSGPDGNPSGSGTPAAGSAPTDDDDASGKGRGKRKGNGRGRGGGQGGSRGGAKKRNGGKKNGRGNGGGGGKKRDDGEKKKGGSQSGGGGDGGSQSGGRQGGGGGGGASDQPAPPPQKPPPTPQGDDGGKKKGNGGDDQSLLPSAARAGLPRSASSVT